MGWEDRGMENGWMDRKISDLGEKWGGGRDLRTAAGQAAADGC